MNRNLRCNETTVPNCTLSNKFQPYWIDSQLQTKPAFVDLMQAFCGERMVEAFVRLLVASRRHRQQAAVEKPQHHAQVLRQQAHHLHAPTQLAVASRDDKDSY